MNELHARSIVDRVRGSHYGYASSTTHSLYGESRNAIVKRDIFLYSECMKSRMPKREPTHTPRTTVRIGSGGETEVWSRTQGERMSTVVTKDYGSIDSARKEQFEQRYQRLRAVYGDIILPQRFMRKKEEPDGWVLVQKRVELDKKSEVLSREPCTLPPTAQRQVEQLIHASVSSTAYA